MYFNTKSMSIYYEKHGTISDKTILILPGWGNTRSTFTNIINFFKNDYTIYIIDYPGFGNSKIPPSDLTIYNYAEIIINFMKKLKISNPIIIAHSFGGRIATIITGYYKIPVTKMVLIDIAGIKPKKKFIAHIKEKLYKFLKKLIRFSKKKEKYQQKLLNTFASNDYQNLPQGMHQTFKNIVNEDLTQYFKYINTECLLLWGKLDEATPLKDGQKINQLLKNSAIIIYPYAHHFPYLEYPYLTNQIILNFFKDE